MRVFLAGATGAIGRQLVPLLVRDGHEVAAITRSESRADWLRSQGVEPAVGDVFDRDWLRQVVCASIPDVVIHQLTSIPPKISPRKVGEQFAATNRLRTEGTYVLMEAARAVGVRRFLAQSVAFFYAPNGDEPASEDDGLDRNLPGAAELVDAIHVHEHAALGSPGIAGMVLRYGYFYGPGTFYARDGGFAQEVLKRRVPIVGKGRGMFSFIHVEDAADATALAVISGGAGIYNIVDDEPAQAAEWLPYYARMLGAPRPFRVPGFVGRWGAGPYGHYMMTRQRGASNAKAKSALDWQPGRPNVREGFRYLEEIEPERRQPVPEIPA